MVPGWTRVDGDAGATYSVARSTTSAGSADAFRWKLDDEAWKGLLQTNETPKGQPAHGRGRKARLTQNSYRARRT